MGGILRLLGSLGLGLAAGACAHAGALREIPDWRLQIMLVLSIAILAIPAGAARLLRLRSTS